MCTVSHMLIIKWPLIVPIKSSLLSTIRSLPLRHFTDEMTLPARERFPTRCTALCVWVCHFYQQKKNTEKMARAQGKHMFFDIQMFFLTFRCFSWHFGIFLCTPDFFAAGQLSHDNNNGYICNLSGWNYPLVVLSQDLVLWTFDSCFVNC